MSTRLTTETILANDPEALAAAAAGLRAWVSSGVCQSASGAFVAWFDRASGRRSYDYPEITGYVLTYLAGQTFLSERERSAGHRAAEWLNERCSEQAILLPGTDGTTTLSICSTSG